VLIALFFALATLAGYMGAGVVDRDSYSQRIEVEEENLEFGISEQRPGPTVPPNNPSTQTLSRVASVGGQVWGVAVSSDGSTIASAGFDGTVRVWDGGSGEQLQLLEGHTGSVWGVAVSSDGSTIASAGDDGTVRVWDGGSGEQIQLLEGHTGSVRGVAVSSDGSTIASASADGTVQWSTVDL
jgi:WD40 repeat protein